MERGTLIRRLFIDCDGVLADFDTRAKEIFDGKLVTIFIRDRRAHLHARAFIVRPS